MCTSWAPPHPILDQWVDLGCTVCCVFLEPFELDVGVYKNEVFWHLRDESAKRRWE